MDLFDQLRGVIGLAVLMGLAWAFSEDRRNHPGWLWMAGALALQGVLAVLIVRVPAVWAAVGLANNAVTIYSELTTKHPTIAVFHYHLAMAHSQRGDKLQAKRSLESALKANPSPKDLEDIKKLQLKLG